MKSYVGRFSLMFAGALTAGSLMFFSAGTGTAHPVPACCIAPYPPNDLDEPYNANYCDARDNAPQAPSSNGGNTVRSENKHCDFDASHGGPKK
jgi:hypothetical protein